MSPNSTRRVRLVQYVLLMSGTLCECRRSSTAQVTPTATTTGASFVPPGDSSPKVESSAGSAPRSPSRPPLPVDEARDAQAPEASAPDAGPSEAKPLAEQPEIEVPYRGTLGGDHVVVRLTQTQSILEGRYFDESSGIDVHLKGHLARDGTFTLKEKGSSARWSGALRGEQLGGKRQLGKVKLDLTAVRVKRAVGPAWEPVFIATKRLTPSCRDGASDIPNFEFPEFVGAFSPEREADINREFLPSEDFLRCSANDYQRLEFRVLYDANGMASIERRESHFQSIVAKERAPNWSIEYRAYSLSAQKRLEFDEVFPASHSDQAVKELFRSHLAEARLIDPGLKGSRNDQMDSLGLQTNNLSVEGNGIRLISAINQAPWNGVLIPYAELIEKNLVAPSSPIASLASKHAPP